MEIFEHNASRIRDHDSHTDFASDAVSKISQKQRGLNYGTIRKLAAAVASPIVSFTQNNRPPPENILQGVNGERV